MHGNAPGLCNNSLQIAQIGTPSEAAQFLEIIRRWHRQCSYEGPSEAGASERNKTNKH